MESDYDDYLKKAMDKAFASLLGSELYRPADMIFYTSKQSEVNTAQAEVSMLERMWSIPSTRGL